MGACLVREKRPAFSFSEHDPQARKASKGLPKNSIYLHWTKPEVGGCAPPTGRYASSCCVVGTKIYVFGGYTGVYDEYLFVFDTVTNEWSRPDTEGVAPCGRAFHAAAVIGTRMFIFGGFNGRFNLNDIYVLETTTMTWSTPRVRGAIPSARFEHKMLALGNYLFLFGGGNSHSWLNDVHVLDTESLIWGLAPVSGDAPRNRCAHTFCAVGPRIVAYGGYDGKARLKDTLIFDPDNCFWETSPGGRRNSAGGRAAHVTVAFDGNMFVFGGYNGKRRLNDTVMYNTVTKLWSLPHVKGTVPSPRSYHCACVIERKMYIFGGYDGTTRSNDVYVMEQVLPSLVDLCVEAVLKHKRLLGPDLKTLPQDLRELVE
eukprot:TRINITY_DN1007_c0_g1_i1.p1 TRINITY_DN1007_c0_g1~~TRINITY_DN1007_c0_g1_i1.p1  ORF type:complete len:371 (+),score=105.35 TRINITY_DN1007_c0_g1_i1:348-1460(+)